MSVSINLIIIYIYIYHLTVLDIHSLSLSPFNLCDSGLYHFSLISVRSIHSHFNLLIIIANFKNIICSKFNCVQESGTIIMNVNALCNYKNVHLR